MEDITTVHGTPIQVTFVPSVSIFTDAAFGQTIDNLSHQHRKVSSPLTARRVSITEKSSTTQAGRFIESIVNHHQNATSVLATTPTPSATPLPEGIEEVLKGLHCFGGAVIVTRETKTTSDTPAPTQSTAFDVNGLELF